MAHDAPISRPQDLAYLLASYARQALARTTHADFAALEPLRQAFDDALGITFEGDIERRFFKSTLVQTLFYGAFSAWVIWASGSEAARGDRFDWRSASWFTNVPVIGALFNHVATAATLRPLRIDEVLDWAGEALNRVERTAFFARFDASDAVTYLYEPFLTEFDPVLRRQLGIWYTPPEVVRYMVGRVDGILRDQFGIPDGLADESVYILDPCTGTGSFLVEVLRVIQQRRTELHGDALVGEDIKKAAQTRVLGFEILPAPFVVAHLQLNLLLARLGAPLDQNQDERVAVYLTNSLTGWDDAVPRVQSLFPELSVERDAAHEVKRQKPILVVLGNPPYNAFAGISPAEEGGLVEPYKEGLDAWGLGTKNSIDDLYVRFLRIAERKITEETGQGIVCMISNFGYLTDPTLVVLRQRLLAEFDGLWIDNLNGDSRETGKKAPDGRADPSIFKTSQSPGIQTGTAIATLARLPQHPGDDELPPTAESADPRDAVLFGDINYREFWGPGKKTDLLASLQSEQPAYSPVAAVADTAYAFRLQQLHEQYPTWPRVADLAEVKPFPGLLEKRRGALVDPDRNALEQRMRNYFDPSRGIDDLNDDLRGLTTPAGRFSPLRTRGRLLEEGGFKRVAIMRFLAKPLDKQWAYVETQTSLWNEARPTLVDAARAGDRFLLVRRRTPRANDGAAFLFSDCLGDDHALHKDAYYVPMRLYGSRARPDSPQQSLFDDHPSTHEVGVRANLSTNTRTWLAQLGQDLEPDGAHADSPWLHCLAIGYSPAYLSDNHDAGRFTYHRIPLPATADLLSRGTELGDRLSMLLDTDQTVPGVTAHEEPGAFWRTIGAVVREVPISGSSLRVEGFAIRQGDRVMPAAGRVTSRPLSNVEGAAWSLVERSDMLGSGVVDIHLNDRARWAGVPTGCWSYSIGGYRVLRKWLSYRDHRVLGRPLNVDEARLFTSLVRRIAALLLMGPELDDYYRACVSNSYHWFSS